MASAGSTTIISPAFVGTPFVQNLLSVADGGMIDRNPNSLGPREKR